MQLNLQIYKKKIILLQGEAYLKIVQTNSSLIIIKLDK